MSKIHHTAAIAALAFALPLAALAQTNLDLDTGTTGASGTGDITFNGTSIAVVGSATQTQIGDEAAVVFATLYDAGASSVALLEEPFSPYSTAPVTGVNFIVYDIIGVHTNGGNYAAMLVTALSSSSITLQYITYNTSGTQLQSGTVTLGAQSGPALPTVAAVVNNYSNILPGAPNYGIAPGSLIVIYGSNLADPGSSASPLQDPSKALPQTLNGSSVSLTVGSTTVHPAFYYAIPTQLAVVIPSSTSVGTGTITVSYGGQTSAPLPITIVPSAFGFDYYQGILATATDNNDYHLITTTKAAYPGETIDFWGSGDGADTSNTDVGPPTSFDNLNGNITALYFGSVQVPVVYQGRSGFQGVDQVAVTIPANAPTGCAVSVVAVIGSGANATVSNVVTMPIASSDGPCTDTVTFIDPTEVATLEGQTTVKFGGLSIFQDTNPSGMVTQDSGGFFYSISGGLLTGYQSSSQLSLGSCSVAQSASLATTNPFSLTGIDVGPISVTGPGGTQQALTESPVAPGFYAASLPAGFVPAAGGDFTFAGTGGNGVAAFSAPLSFPNPLTWTNSTADATISRSQGALVTWTGGAKGTYVQINGNSTSQATGFYASFTCDAPVSGGSFTVPAAVLLALPPGTGTLKVSNYTIPSPFKVTGLDFAYTIGFVSTDIDATFQ